MGVPVAKRLRKRRDFKMVRTEDRALFAGLLFFSAGCFRQIAKPTRRFEVIASRRVGNAVRHNRGKRLMRELFRLHGVEAAGVG